MLETLSGFEIPTFKFLVLANDFEFWIRVLN